MSEDEGDAAGVLIVEINIYIPRGWGWGRGERRGMRFMKGQTAVRLRKMRVNKRQARETSCEGYKELIPNANMLT